MLIVPRLTSPFKALRAALAEAALSVTREVPTAVLSPSNKPPPRLLPGPTCGSAAVQGTPCTPPKCFPMASGASSQSQTPLSCWSSAQLRAGAAQPRVVRVGLPHREPCAGGKALSSRTPSHTRGGGALFPSPLTTVPWVSLPSSPCRMPPSPTASTSCEKSTLRNSTAGKSCPAALPPPWGCPGSPGTEGMCRSPLPSHHLSQALLAPLPVGWGSSHGRLLELGGASACVHHAL